MECHESISSDDSSIYLNEGAWSEVHFYEDVVSRFGYA